VLTIEISKAYAMSYAMESPAIFLIIENQPPRLSDGWEESQRDLPLSLGKSWHYDCVVPIVRTMKRGGQ